MFFAYFDISQNIGYAKSKFMYNKNDKYTIMFCNIK